MSLHRDSSNMPSQPSGLLLRDARSGRACDQCRAKKLRCWNSADTRTPCQRCSSRNAGCTYLQPAPTDVRATKRMRGVSRLEPPPGLEGLAQRLDTRLLGATSVSSIILASIMAVESSTHLEGGLKLMDEKYHLKRKMGPTGLRYILVARVPAQIEIPGNSVGKKRRKLGAQDKEQIDLTAFSLDMDYERLGERHHVQGLHDLLYSIYEETILPIFPAISKTELDLLRHQSKEPRPAFDNLSLPPVVDLVICTLASLSRTVPRGIFRELSHALTSTFDSVEGMRVFTISSIGHVQTMLLLTMSPELQGKATNHGGSLTFLRIGMALRMSQDLGLHRALSEDEVSRPQLLRRRRVWKACLIADKWISLAHGQPSMACSRDCDNTDVCLNSPVDDDPSAHNLQVHQHLANLSQLLGRLLFTLYSPNGVSALDHPELMAVRAAIINWSRGLPADFCFDGETDGKDSQREALRLFYVPVLFFLYRPFLSLDEDSHLLLRPYTPTPGEWGELVKHAKNAIHWLESSGSTLLDMWWFACLGLISAALTHFYSVFLGVDQEALVYLVKAKDLAMDWARSLDLADTEENEQFRFKVANLLEFMYQVAAARYSVPSGSDIDAFSSGSARGQVSIGPFGPHQVPQRYLVLGLRGDGVSDHVVPADPPFEWPLLQGDGTDSLSTEGYMELMSLLTDGLF